MVYGQATVRLQLLENRLYYHIIYREGLTREKRRSIFTTAVERNNQP